MKFPIPVRQTTPLALAPNAPYSDWYYRRLAVHRFGSYAILPLFVAQYVVGTQLAKGEENDWAEDAHPVLAAGVGVRFASNALLGDELEHGASPGTHRAVAKSSPSSPHPQAR